MTRSYTHNRHDVVFLKEHWHRLTGGTHPFGSAQGRLFAKFAKDGAPSVGVMPMTAKAWRDRHFLLG